MNKTYKLTLEFCVELIISFIILFIGLYYNEYRLIIISFFALIFALVKPITEYCIKKLGSKE